METVEYIEFVGPDRTTVLNVENIPVYWRQKGQDHTNIVRDKKRIDLVNVNFSDLADYLKEQNPEQYKLIESKTFDAILYINPAEVDLVFTIQHKGKIYNTICGVIYRGRSYEVPMSVKELANLISNEQRGESAETLEGDLGELLNSEDTPCEDAGEDTGGDTGNLSD